MELRRDDVRTMLVCPGYVKTGFQQHVTAGQAPEKVMRARRLAITAEECAAAIRRGVERDARTVVTPAVGWILVALARLFPGDRGGAHGGDERNRMNLRLKRTPGIYVVGFMASGKSTIGRHLAHRLGWSFFDTDDEIEAAEKITIAEIFGARRGGIPAHRSRDHPAARSAGSSAGGRRCWRWAAARSWSRRIAQLLADNGIAVWLDCPFEVVERRVAKTSHRPLAHDPEKFAALFQARREAYRLADIHIPIESDDPAVTVEAILRASAV